jgi:tetratricopeptide (TPR) repeat protein
MMGRIEKTVFISYRRTNMPWALAIYQHLTSQGYDVFFDYLSIPSGDFEKIIAENIRGRAHFVVILTPSALERCQEPGDWLRREIETAMEEKRNIVPLMLESFDFGSPATIKALTGKLENLKKYNALRVPSEYFFEAMNRLREQFLNVALEAIIHPMPEVAMQITEEHQVAASRAKRVEKEELTAQEWLERSYSFSEARNFDEAIRCASEAIRLRQDFAHAYANRGYAVIESNGSLDEALNDLNKAIKLKPDEFSAYNNRGRIYHDQGNQKKALSNYNASIKYNPNYHHPYNNRGMIYQARGDFDKAVRDYNQAIHIRPDYVDAYINRGLLRYNSGELDLANKDYTEAIRINPGYANAYYNRALIWEKKRDYSSAIADYQKYLEFGGGIQYGDQKEAEEYIKKLKGKLTKKKSAKKKTK